MSTRPADAGTARVPVEARPGYAGGAAAGSDRPHGGWPRRLALLAPPVLLALLGGWLLSRRYGLWYDELYTAELVRVPLDRLASALVRGEGPIAYLRDAPPSYNAPYYAVAHLWLAVTGLPADELGLRLLSLVSAVGAAAVFTRAATRLAGARTGAIAGLLFAANPFVVQFAAEGRGYALAVLAVSAAVLGFARWLDGRPGALVLYGAAGAAAGLAHWFALLVPIALAIAALVLRRRRALPVVAATLAATLPALCVIGIAVANGVGSSGAEWISDVGGAVPRLLLTSWGAGDTPLMVATVAAAALGLLARSRSPRPARIVGTAWVAVPLALVTLGEMIRPVYVDRYLLPSVIGLALLMALGLRAVRPAAAAVALTVSVLGASLVATARDVRAGPKEDVRSAVEAVAAGHERGEPVVAAARWDALGLDHYARRDHPALVPDLVLPPSPLPAAERLWVLRRSKGGVKGDRTKLAALDQELLGRGMHPAEQLRFDGRHADVLVQRWERPAFP